MEWRGSLDRVLLWEADRFESGVELATPEGTIVLAGLFTDRDRDGDLDLLLTSDHELPTAFWRNDGDWVEDAGAVGAQSRISAMGIDSGDLNGDGELDYCITDIGPVSCLLSFESGWVDGSVSHPLTPAVPAGVAETVGWSLDLLDFDHDGAPDAWQPAGAPGGEASGDSYPDLLWAGGDGFVDVSAVAGVQDSADHYGGAAADLDGDGSLDLLAIGPGDIPRLWMNRCSAGAWVEVALVGPPGNRDGIGAQVEATVGGRTWLQEIHTRRGFGQRPPTAWLGLGEADAVDIVVPWPGGERTEAAGLPLRRRLTLRSEDAG